MIFDSTNLFSDAQAITADAASTNVIDFGATDTPQHAANAITRDIGKGTPIALRIQVVETFDNLTTLGVDVQVDTVENFASPTTLVSSTATLAELVAGYVFPIQTVVRGVAQRYMRLNYDVTGTAPTAGAITAGFVFANEQRDV